MPKKRHSPEQIAAALRQAEAGTPIADITRKLGVHENTFYLWKKHCGQLGTPEIRELRQLCDENFKLKRLVADLTLDKTMLQDVLGKKVVKPAPRRALVGNLKERYGISERRACAATHFNRSSIQYRGQIAPLNEALRARIKDIAAARIRYGYRRIHVLLRREGWTVNAKRVARLYRAEGLSLRAKSPKRRRSANVRQPRLVITAANQVWSLGFMHDRLADNARGAVRLLTIVDVFTRECLALELLAEISYRIGWVLSADNSEAAFGTVYHRSLSRIIGERATCRGFARTMATLMDVRSSHIR